MEWQNAPLVGDMVRKVRIFPATIKEVGVRDEMFDLRCKKRSRILLCGHTGCATVQRISNYFMRAIFLIAVNSPACKR